VGEQAVTSVIYYIKYASHVSALRAIIRGLRGKRKAECEASTAATMKNVIFWDIKAQFILHRRHITSPLQSQAS
jgi:hypothetical protein